MVSQDVLKMAEECVLCAPPRKLFDVLSEVRVLIGDDPLFFQTIPRICLEYHQRCGSLITLDWTAVELQYRAEFNASMCFVATQRNHLLSWALQSLGTAAAANDEDVWEELNAAEELEATLAEFFTCLPCQDLVSIMDTNAAGTDLLDNLLDDEGISGAEDLNHLFFDIKRRVYVEIDPLEGCCLRVFSFASSTFVTEVPPVIQRLEAFPTHEVMSSLSAKLVEAVQNVLHKQHQRTQQLMVSAARKPLLPQTAGHSPQRDDDVFESDFIVSTDESNDAGIHFTLLSDWESKRNAWTASVRTHLYLFRASSGTIDLSGESILRIFAGPLPSSSFHHREKLLMHPISIPCESQHDDEVSVCSSVEEAIKRHLNELSGRLRHRLSERCDDGKPPRFSSSNSGYLLFRPPL